MWWDSWLQLQMSVVMWSISCSTVDCNSTTFWPRSRSSSGTKPFCTWVCTWQRPSWSKCCTIAIYYVTWNALHHCWHSHIQLAFHPCLLVGNIHIHYCCTHSSSNTTVCPYPYLHVLTTYVHHVHTFTVHMCSCGHQTQCSCKPIGYTIYCICWAHKPVLAGQSSSSALAGPCLV